MSERLSLVISKSLKKKIDNLKEKTHTDQSTLIRQLLVEAVEKKQMDLAIEEYSAGKISLGKAVELSESDYWSFLEMLHNRHIPLNIDDEDALKEIERIKAGDYKKFLKKTRTIN